MRLLFARSYGTRSSVLGTRLLSARLRPGCRVGLNKVGPRVMKMQMAHIAQPSLTSFIPLGSSPEDNDPLTAQALALVFSFDTLFCRSPPDLSEQVLSNIILNPGFDCVLALASAIICTGPELLDASIRSVVQILPRTADYGRHTFQDEFKALISHIVHDGLQELYLQHTADTPSKAIFAAALFSASAVKLGLLDEDFIYTFTRFGLQILQVAVEFEDGMQEVAAIGAIGACLQLITAGSVFMEKHFAEIGLDNIIAALEALRFRSHITHPRGLLLLEKTIEAAKANFANPLSPLDAWDILFPSE